jgi:hypothetical protein
MSGLTNAPLSPLRQWVQGQLFALFLMHGKEIRSDQKAQVFTDWTGATQSWLQQQWATERQDLVNGKMRAVTTTCNSFLNVMVNKIRRAGGLANSVFPSFDLPKAGGAAWHWQGESSLPKPGDFYQIGTRGGSYKHVGIVFDIDGIVWTTAEAGQGGPRVNHDSIKLNGPRVINTGIMGWIDIDEFFKGWNG